jgi:hypothetical protein
MERDVIEPEQEQPRAEEPSEEGLLETTISVLSQPVPTMRRLTRKPRWGWAVIVTVVISVGSSLAMVAQGGPLVGAQPGFAPPPELEQQLRAVGLVFALVGPVVAVIALAVGAGLVQVSSYLLGGKGGYAGLFTGLGFASLPNALGIPAMLLPRLLGGAGSALAGLVNLGALVWAVVLSVIAVRENHEFSTGRAVAALLIPVAVLVGGLIGLAVLVLFAFLLAGGFAS